MIRKTELEFIATLIGVAETRLAVQAAVVDNLSNGSNSQEARQAHETLELLTNRVISLQQQRARMIESMRDEKANCVSS